MDYLFYYALAGSAVTLWCFSEGGIEEFFIICGMEKWNPKAMIFIMVMLWPLVLFHIITEDVE